MRHCDHYGDKRYKDMHHRKYGEQEVDAVIVGLGAAGGVLLRDLAKAGLSVVGIDAGPFWDPAADFVSDELHARTLNWQDTRLSTGKNPIRFGHNNSGRGVGGGTVHFTGVFYRFHASDFEMKTRDGVGEDWPISYWDLEPYYSKLEQEIKVSGPREFPWGEFHGPYPYPEREPISGNAQIFRRGCEALGIRSTTAPLAILSAPYEVRPDTAHLHGGCRMGKDPSNSVVNEFCQSHDIPNLFICDASVFVTSGACNPTETIMAIAARTAEHIAEQKYKGQLRKLVTAGR